MTRRPIITTLLLLALVTAACRATTPTGDRTPTPGPTATATATGSPAATVTVYYLVSGTSSLYITPERHQVAEASPRAALETLVAATPQDPQHARPLPDGTRVLGVDVRGTTATADWSAEILEGTGGAAAEQLAIQAVVYTLTEFEGVDRVRFTVEGKDRGIASNGRRIEDFWGHVGLRNQPFSRDEDFIVAPIVVWTPLDGEQVGMEIVANGEASVFEANVGIRLFDEDGRKVLEDFVTASEGAPGRGTWDIHISLNARTLGGREPPTTLQRWRLEAFESSAKDGSDTFVESREIVVGPLD